MSRALADLDDVLRPLATSFCIALTDAGIKYIVTETRRTYADQNGAYKRGASKCDGLQKISLHQAGLAIDICPMGPDGGPTWDYLKYRDTYKQIADIARKLGLESGQDWTPINLITGLGWDPPHYQYKGG